MNIRAKNCMEHLVSYEFWQYFINSHVHFKSIQSSRPGWNTAERVKNRAIYRDEHSELWTAWKV